MALLHTEVILSPEGTSNTTRRQLAPRRFRTLDGVRLGLLGNSKLNADAVLLAVGELLQEKLRRQVGLHAQQANLLQASVGGAHRRGHPERGRGPDRCRRLRVL